MQTQRQGMWKAKPLIRLGCCLWPEVSVVTNCRAGAVSGDKLSSTDHRRAEAPAPPLLATTYLNFACARMRRVIFWKISCEAIGGWPKEF